jgi:STE24 endopeptidase
MFLSWAISLAMLFALSLVLTQSWFYVGLGMREPSQAAALLLFMLVVPEFLFFLRPLMSVLSRKREFEADQYATQNASARDLENALVKLYKDNASTLTPDPIHSAFYDSHPPAAIRIARLRTA